MARIVVTRPIVELGLDQLRAAGHEVVVHDDWLMNEEQLQDFVRGADVLLTLLTDPVTASVMDAAGPQLKMIASYNVGYDNIDLAAARDRGIVVTHTSGSISSAAVAEHAIALMMAVARNIRRADTFMRSGQYRHWGPNVMTGIHMRGATLGIVGSGEIGSIFANMCRLGFGMNVLYTDVVENVPLETLTGARRVSLHELLQQADVVSLHVPLLAETRHMLSYDEFAMMKPTAIIVNTARGPVLDEVALVHALREGKIYGAGLDVFEFEPYLAEGLAELENVVVTPHIASATQYTRSNMSTAVAANILAVLEGRAPADLVPIPAH
jgi:lactate dehydrogenase-like 2-hydroxyacid dehydrogenase